MAYTMRNDILKERVCSWLKKNGGWSFDRLFMKAWTKNHARFEDVDLSDELWYYDTAADNDEHALEWAVGDLLGNASLWADTVKVTIYCDGKKYQERFSVPKDVPVLVNSEAEYNGWKTKVL